MKKRIILVGGPHDTADNPMSAGVSVRDYIGDGVAPLELSYGIGEDRVVYNYNRRVDGNYVYTVSGLGEEQMIELLVKNYGKYEKFVTELERRVRHEVEDNEIAP